MTLEFDLRTYSLNQSRTWHWTKRSAQARLEKRVVWGEWNRIKRPKVEVPCVVTITRIARNPLDSDNLASSNKAVRDQIAEIIGIDDGDERIEWNYKQEKAGKPKVYRIRIEIESQRNDPANNLSL